MQTETTPEGKKKRNPEFVNNLFFFFFCKAFFAITLFGIGILTARLLAPADRGYYALFFTMVGIGTNAINPGLSQANTYYLNREKIPLGVLLSNTFSYILFIAIVLVALFYMEHQAVLSFIDDAIPEWLLWVAIITMVTEISISGLIYGSQLYDLQSRSLIVQAVTLVIATILIIPIKANLETAIALRVGASVVFLIWYFFNFLRYVKPVRLKFSLPKLVKQLRFGGRNWIQNFIGLLNYRGYILILGAISDPKSIAIFSIALLFIEPVRFFPDTVATLLLPKLVGMPDGNDVGPLVARTIRLISFAMLALTGCLYLIVPRFVPLLFGNEYIEGVLLLKIMLPGAVFGTFYQVLSRYFTSQSKQKYTIYSAAIGLFTAALAAYFLVQEYGAIGAAFAFTISSLMTAISILFAFRFHSGLSLFKNALIIKSGDLGFIKSQVILLVHRKKI